jgi:IS30 family transposase
VVFVTEPTRPIKRPGNEHTAPRPVNWHRTLRRNLAMRRSRHHTQKTADHGRFVDTVSISERPPEIGDRAVPGHWEGDLLFGSNSSQIATLVERHTRYVMLVRVPSKDTKTVIEALIKQAHKLPRERYKSLTWDRGKEMADHKRFRLRHMSTCSSVIHSNRGSAVPTRTPTDSCDSTFRRVWISATYIRIG